MPKSRKSRRWPIQGEKIDLPALAKTAVARAVKRGVTNLDDLYITAERSAKRRLIRAYNAATPRLINNHSAVGRRHVSRAANIQRAQNGMLHQHLVAAVLGRVTSASLASRSKGDLLINGNVVECKRTLRERQRQIFSDGNRVSAVVLRSIDADDEKRHVAEYARKHGAKLVVPGGHADVAVSLTDYVASIRHIAHDKVMA